MAKILLFLEHKPKRHLLAKSFTLEHEVITADSEVDLKAN